MGACQCETRSNKLPAADKLQAVFAGIAERSTALAFIIKEWPDRNNVDLLRHSQSFTRFQDISLYPGEKIQLVLNNHKIQDVEKGRGSIQPGGKSPLRPSVLSKKVLHCDVTRDSQYYKVSFPRESEYHELWRYTSGWTMLNEGDTFKMGVTKYQLVKFMPENDGELEELRRTLHPQVSKIEESAPRCRICLSSIDTPENPFISPCKCQGTIKYTHLRCLSAWLFSSCLTQDQHLTITINKTVCQLCKTDITNTPQYIKMENLLLTNITDIPSPFGIFKLTTYHDFQGLSNSYMVLCFKGKKEYTFGRNNMADIGIQDYHISKLNTEMRYSNDRLFIRDQASLHGTLLQVREPLRFNKTNLTEIIVFHNMLCKIMYQPHFQQKQQDCQPQPIQNEQI